ncbi:MAG TPA: N-acetyl-alpha-D-glucosaminyl L-malate synthase BshA, partial [Bacteroidia bacterium]|nr:N-acetyl-alpha-D-glucosaminyl L-malate synthase BshA [Bacteroidia bacterium]
NVNGVTGFTSDVGNVNEMAANALKILSSPETHHKFKEAAFNHSKKFGLDIIMPQYEAVYQQVIQKHLTKVL